MSDRYLKVVEPSDNVATALRDIEAGETIEIGVSDETRTVKAREDVQFGHKLAIENIEAGETIIKYAKSIGNATEDIPAGTWVHVQNVESNYGRGDKAGGEAKEIHE